MTGGDWLSNGDPLVANTTGKRFLKTDARTKGGNKMKIERRMISLGSCFAMFLVLFSFPVSPLAQGHFELVARFAVPEANQGVGVDLNYFYAINNRVIAKYDKVTGKFVAKWEGASGGPIIHLDSAMVMSGKIYCAHSNYNDWPMTSSVEVWDANTLEHIETHSFGIHWGSLTWLDWYNNSWWATFANYDRPSDGIPYGGKINTTLVKFDAKWQFQEAWIYPKALLDKFEDMSNSGGSWGPDGYLYLSGHDPQEVYKVKLPSAGSIVEFLEVLPVDIRGQGIAWDRSVPGKNKGLLYGIKRAEREVTVHRYVE